MDTKNFYELQKSLKDQDYYIDQTSNLSKRLIEHNQEKTKSIKHRLPFELYHYE